MPRSMLGKENREGKKPNKGPSLWIPLVIIEALFCWRSSETKCRTYLWAIALTLQLFQPSLSGASTLLQSRKPSGKENRCFRRRLLGTWKLFTETEVSSGWAKGGCGWGINTAMDPGTLICTHGLRVFARGLLASLPVARSYCSV